MSFDTLVSLALFGGALFLMRFGCGAHMRHAHSHAGSSPNQSADGATASLDSAYPVRPAENAHKTPNDNAHRHHGCC
jgi:hypothetical protein